MSESGSMPVQVGPAGRVVIPARMRRELGVSEGDRLSARIEGGALILEPPVAAIRRIQDRLAGTVSPGHSVVDELIAERHAEARQDVE